MLRNAVILVAAAVLATAQVREYWLRGGPYLQWPETIEDHTSRGQNSTRDVIMLCRRAEPFLPRRAELTIIRPSEAPNYNYTMYLTGVGMLPYIHVVFPNMTAMLRKDLPDYVIAVRDPLPHPEYRLVAEFPEGRLYALRP